METHGLSNSPVEHSDGDAWCVNKSYLVQVQLHLALGLEHLRRAVVERVVGVAPAVPHGRGHRVDQGLGVTPQLA